MPILMSAHALSKKYAERPLFEDITFIIETGERIGLIGPNGAGKSTLLNILAGFISPDQGTLSVSKGIKIGYLPQVPAFKNNATVFSAISEGTQSQDWEEIALVEEYISKLSLNQNGITPETKIEHLSGGWQKRVALARELVRNPDLLLLDEPTNHLDVESILWLESFLAKVRFATLTVTHDRLFLQRIADRILELDKRNPNGLLSVNNDYAGYLEVKEQLMQAQEKRETVLKNTLRRETEWLRRGAKARTTKQQARIQRVSQLQTEVSQLETRNQVRVAGIEFSSSGPSPKSLIEAKNISKSFGSKTLFQNLDLLIRPGSRIALLGKNGSGKTSLIRTLLGEEETDSGTVVRSERLKVAYFEQNREVLDPQTTLANTLCPKGDFVEFRGQPIHIRSYLNRFLFTQPQMNMPVGKLSGGEQSRVLIAQLMLQSANVLVLDEPTNDLDMATLNILEECLIQFDGAVLLVTHDRYFLDQVATQILAFPEDESSKLISFASLEQWENWHQDHLQKTQTGSQKKIPPIEIQKNTKKKLSFNEQNELANMEENILKLEEQLQHTTHELTLCENMQNPLKLKELTQKMHGLQNQINQLYKRWAELDSYK